MKTIICGAGNVGLSIALYLELKGHDVTIIDQSEDLVKNVSDRHDIRAICGFASDPAILGSAGAKDADDRARQARVAGGFRAAAR